MALICTRRYGPCAADCAPRGEILIANYAAPTQDTPLDGPTVHRQAEAVLDLPMRARYQDADLTIQAWGEPRSLHQEYGGVS